LHAKCPCGPPPPPTHPPHPPPPPPPPPPLPVQREPGSILPLAFAEAFRHLQIDRPKGRILSSSTVEPHVREIGLVVRGKGKTLAAARPVAGVTAIQRMFQWQTAGAWTRSRMLLQRANNHGSRAGRSSKQHQARIWASSSDCRIIVSLGSCRKNIFRERCAKINPETTNAMPLQNRALPDLAGPASRARAAKPQPFPWVRISVPDIRQHKNHSLSFTVSPVTRPAICTVAPVPLLVAGLIPEPVRNGSNGFFAFS